MKLKSSLLMSTYNGEKYIKEQLDSIVNQTRNFDEIIICDDCSTDSTLDIVRDFITRKNIKATVIVNQKNIGWKNNYINLIKMANNDIIFLCDQDDVWRNDKCEKMMNTMEQNSSIATLVSNYMPKYEGNNCKIISKEQYSFYGNNIVENISNEKYYLCPQRPGCTYCFRKELVKTIDDVWFPECAHDQTIWAISSVLNSLYIYNDNLIEFRRHNKNNTPSNNKNSKTRIELIEMSLILAENIKKTKSIDINNDILQKIDEVIRFNDMRLELIKSKKYINLIKLLNCIKLYPKPISYFGDVVSLINNY